MFWANIYAMSPHIEALLKKDDVTLYELMDQEEIVPECKSQNKKLVEYLSRPDVMQELVTLTTKEPSSDLDERSRYKYSNVACELLTCNVPSLNEKLAGDETLLAKLYSFIDTDEPLNPLLASFFSKTIGVLLTRKSDQNWYSYQFMCLQVLEFLKSREKCVDRLLQHLETSAIMDLVLKLVTKVEGSDMRQNVLNWLDSQQLVQRLIKLLSPTSDSARHANASLLLCDMIKLGRYFLITCTERTDPDPILNTLESEETVSSLLETILTGEPVESSIVGGIQVLLVLLGHETNPANDGDAQGNSAGDDTSDDENRVKIQNATLPYLELLQKLLLNPPPKPPVKTTAGLLTSPLGNTRLHVAKLLVALLYTENIEIFRRLAQLGTFQILLDLFFKYSWNNFLHTQVEQCLASVINGDWQENSEFIYSHIFVECKLINRLLEAWDKNEGKENKGKAVRQGYMGHLINIGSNIAKECSRNQVLDAFLKTNPSPECAKQWEELVNNELVEINKTHHFLLGGTLLPYMSGSDDPNDDYDSFGQDAYIQQVYANYQGQQMTAEIFEHCIHDDAFNDRDAARPNSNDQLTTMTFTLNEEDLDQDEILFNKICQQKQKAGLDESGGAVEWGDEGELTFQTVIDKRDWPSKQQHNDSNSSDEDEDPRELNMEVDSTDPWGAAEPLSGNSVLPRVNPWDVNPSEPVSTNVVLPRVNPWDVNSSENADAVGGWANFDNFDSAMTIGGASAKFSNSPTIVPESASSPTSTVAASVDVGEIADPGESAIVSAPEDAAKPDATVAIADGNDEKHSATVVEDSVSQIATVELQSRKAEVVEASQLATVKETPGGGKVAGSEVVEELSPTKIRTVEETSSETRKIEETCRPVETATAEAAAQPEKNSEPTTMNDDSKTIEESKKIGDSEKKEIPTTTL